MYQLMNSNDIQSALEALYEDEGLTDNLTDAPAKTLLAWAETQIKAGVEPKTVRTAARAANREDLADTTAVLAAANTALGAVAQPVVLTSHVQAAPEQTAETASQTAIAPEPTSETNADANGSSALTAALVAGVTKARQTLAELPVSSADPTTKPSAQRPKSKPPITAPRRRSWWQRLLRRS